MQECKCVKIQEEEVQEYNYCKNLKVTKNGKNDKNTN